MDKEIEEQIERIKKHITVRSVSRAVLKGIAKHSVGFVAATVAKTYCPTESKKQELQLAAGAYVIGAMAGDAAADYVEREFDEAIDFLSRIRHHADEVLNEKPEETPNPIGFQTE